MSAPWCRSAPANDLGSGGRAPPHRPTAPQPACTTARQGRATLRPTAARSCAAHIPVGRNLRLCLTKLGRVRPQLAPHFERTWPELGRLGPSQVKLCRHLTFWRRMPPTSTNFDQIRARVPEFWPTLGPNFEQSRRSWAKLGQVSATSGRLRLKFVNVGAKLARLDRAWSNAGQASPHIGPKRS